jgi:hypothetical protein
MNKERHQKTVKCDRYFPNNTSGGHRNQRSDTRITAFIATATSVLRAERRLLGDPGHIPEKTTIPKTEITEPPIASCLQASSLPRMPKKDTDPTIKHKVDVIQNGMANIAAIFSDKEGSSQDRTITGDLVTIPRAWIRSATSAIPCANPCRRRDPVISTLVI